MARDAWRLWDDRLSEEFVFSVNPSSDGGSFGVVRPVAYKSVCDGLFLAGKETVIFPKSKRTFPVVAEKPFLSFIYRGATARTYPHGFVCSSSGGRKQIRKTFLWGGMFFYQRPAHICNLIHKRCCRQFAMFHLFQHRFPFCS